ncbi:MAG: BamA/TamA family outer membrane protein, partial [Sphingomonadales bacterium]|nr:BamA/TamA family outer membrane protein [Sphingomonadales bacterium]
RTSSILGASLIYDTLDNRVHPTRGRVASANVDFAGLGGSVKYLRGRLNAAQYWPVGKGFIFSVSGEGGIIKALSNNNDPNVDNIRLTDRFYLGEPELRGFDIRGVGPRVLRKYYSTDANGALVEATDRNQWSDDAIGGRFYYQGRAELEIPLGSGAKEMGIRPSIFADIGAVWGIKTPQIFKNITYPYTVTCNSVSTTVTNETGVAPTLGAQCTGASDGVSSSTPFREYFVGNTWKPRLSVGVGFNWNSPFGPFRIDFAKTILKRDGDDPKSFTFNVGTQF